MNSTKLTFLGQCAVFTLSPLVVPSSLCFIMLLLAIFDPKMLDVFSIPMIFSMVLGMLPAVVVGFISATIRHCLKLKSHKFNIMIWYVLSIVMSSFISAKFMTKVSMDLVTLAYVTGTISAIIACSSILLLEHFRNMIIFSRFYYKKMPYIH